MIVVMEDADIIDLKYRYNSIEDYLENDEFSEFDEHEQTSIKIYKEIIEDLKNEKN